MKGLNPSFLILVVALLCISINSNVLASEKFYKVRLVVQIDSGLIEFLTLPPFEKWLSGAGLDVVTVNLDEADVNDPTFIININGHALNQKYSHFSFDPSGQTRYSGAMVTGKVIYYSPNGENLIKSFGGKVSQPDSIFHNSFTHPDNAPFDQALHRSNLADKMVELLHEIYGERIFIGFWLRAVFKWDGKLPKYRAISYLTSFGREAVEPIVLALADGDLPDQSFANECLQAIGGRDSENVIEPLIGLLNHDSSSVRLYSKTMLQEFGKEDFGGDQNLWQGWWKKNKKEN